jgi:predicted enzyme related to lactoylglutathione lyase
MSRIVAPFCWYELMTTDLDGAERFYGAVIGWFAKDAGTPGLRYSILSTGAAPVAGVMALPEPLAAAGVPPHWLAYVRVEDVDATIPRLVAAGGTVHKEPADIPGVGRFAVVADPGGAAFCLFREAGSPPECRDDASRLGRVGWHELQAHDGDAAVAFYGDLFGWREVDRFDMGPTGIYHLFATDGAMTGGIMTKLPEVPRPFWLLYFSVETLDAALDRVKAGGGRVALEPMQVPGGDWIAQCFDPQGGFFALLAPRR